MPIFAHHIQILRKMSRKKRPLPILENVLITDCAAEGKSLARVDDMVVFVPFAVPGDVVDLQVRKKKHHYCEAEVIRFVKKSERRAEPMCAHFGVCGGCKWQNLPYDAQLEMKQRQVFDQLSRIGKVELPSFNDILGSVHTRFYRNKLEFGCCNRRWLTREEVASGVPLEQPNAIGFHITGAFDKILPIEQCWLMDPLHNEIRNAIRDYAYSTGMTFFDLRAQHGLLRDIMLRNSATGEWMVLIQFHFDEAGDEERARGLLQHVADRFPQITSLLYVDNQKCNDTFGDLDIQTFKGVDHIYEVMEGLRFKVGPKSFYQTNSEQAFRLYSFVAEFAELQGDEVVYDLYTGTGTIAQFLASKCRKVVGIEYVEEAIADARENAAINGFDNCVFYAGDMAKVLTADFIADNGKPDIIITDPPRAGMHEKVIEQLLSSQARKIVYVSCNPATQARDLAMLSSRYETGRIQPVDMFPHTQHVENVAELTLRS